MTLGRPRRTSRDKVQAYRDRMRRGGMRQIQMWVPDTSTAAFKAEARRQSLNIAASTGEADDQAFIDSISVLRADDAW